MNSIHRIFKNGVAIEKLNLDRATINESQEIKDNLLDDIDCSKIIIDLSACNYIDSTFFGALVFAYRVLVHQECAVVIVVGKTFLSSSFLLDEIKSVFNVYYSLDEAITVLNSRHNKFSSDDDCVLQTKNEPARIVPSHLSVCID